VGLRRKASDVVEARCSERRERPALRPDGDLGPDVLTLHDCRHRPAPSIGAANRR
jgi:hypothetical protein